MTITRALGPLAFVACFGCSEADVLPPGATVTSVGIQPRSADLEPSASQQFNAVVEFSDGSSRTVAVLWNATGGSISASGSYTAPAASGSYLVIARHPEAGIADTASVTVLEPGAPPPPPPSPPPAGSVDTSLATNLPPSMTLLTDNRWMGPLLTPNSSNWSLWRDPGTNQLWEVAFTRNGPLPTLATDSTAPSTDKSVLVQTYSGVTDGNEPRFPFLQFNGNNEIFISMWVKFHPQWRQPSGSGIKWHLIADGNGFIGWFGLGPTTPGVEGHPNVRFTFQYGACASGNCPSSRDVLASPTSGANLVRGQWNKVQYYVRKNPARVAIWVNDVAVVNKTDFTFASTSGIREIELGGTWGGGIGYSGPTNNVLWYDRVAVWRRP